MQVLLMYENVEEGSCAFAYRCWPQIAGPFPSLGAQKMNAECQNCHALLFCSRFIPIFVAIKPSSDARQPPSPLSSPLSRLANTMKKVHNHLVQADCFLLA